MSDQSHHSPESPAPRQISLWGLFQLLTAIGVLLGVGYYLGVFWGIISVPVLFAAIAAINFSDVERRADMRLKRMMNLLTLFACGAGFLLEHSKWLYEALELGRLFK